MSEVVAVSVLVAVLAFAVIRPRGLPEAVAAVPGAVVVLLVGAVTPMEAYGEARRLLPVVAFLAAVLVISELCAAEGVFRYLGAVMAKRSGGNPVRLLGLVFIVATATTAVLSLDATVVLLTPVVFATVARIGVRPKPAAYACGHLANAGSLWLPVSNLTNLLAMSAAGLTFVSFAGVMALPALVVVLVEYVVFRIFFARDLTTPFATARDVDIPERPTASLVVVGLTLVGFVVASLVGVDPAWIAAGGALVLAVRARSRRTVRFREVARFVNVGFLAFVVALGIIVAAVVRGGLGALIDRLTPGGTSLPALFAWAAIAVLLANLVNNLPAVLVLLPFAADAGTMAVLAVLIGVNVGPNLTYVGSLATLLWRRIVHAHDHRAPLREFTILGILTVPLAVAAGVLALWASGLIWSGLIRL